MSLSPLAQRIYRTLVRQLGLPNPLIAYGDLVRALGALPPPDTNLKPNDQRVIILGGCSRRNELSMRPRSFVCGSGNITDAVETLASTGYQDRFLSHFGRIELVRPGLYERLLRAANFSGNWTAWRTRGCICRLRSIRTTPTGSLQNAEPGATFAFDLRRYPFQEEVLNVLAAEREVQNKFRHLVVAATGTGKTMIAAFEYATLSRQSGTRPPICPARSRFTRNTPVTRSWSAWDTVRWNAGRISERASSTLLNPRRMPPSSLARATISEHESLQAGWFFTV